jgi:hypothetical protein
MPLFRLKPASLKPSHAALTDAAGMPLRGNLFQSFKPFASDRELKIGDPGDVTAWSCED